MSILGPYPLTVVENEDFGPLVFTYYPAGPSGSPFDFTGYTASMMFRHNASDTSVVLTLTPTLGGAAGTLSISWTAAQATTIVAAFTSGWFDVLLTSPGGLKSHFIPQSQVTTVRSVTR